MGWEGFRFVKGGARIVGEVLFVRLDIVVIVDAGVGIVNVGVVAIVVTVVIIVVGVVIVGIVTSCIVIVIVAVIVIVVVGHVGWIGWVRYWIGVWVCIARVIGGGIR